MTDTRSNLAVVAADMCGGDTQRLLGERLKKGVHGGNLVSPVREPLRLGLRGDTLKEVLLDGERAPTS
jgi:hypothetical protein